MPANRALLVAVTALTLGGCDDHALFELGGLPAEIGGDMVALRTRAPDASVVIEPDSSLGFADHFALEVWVYPHARKAGTIFCKEGDVERKRVEATDALSLVVTVAMSSEPNEQRLTADGLSLGAWHHVALSDAQGVMRLFIDGQVKAEVARMDPVLDGDASAYLGSCGVDASVPVDFSFSDLRFSKVGRYSDPFVPEPRLVVDAKTSALFPLDDGEPGPLAEPGPFSITGSIAGDVTWQALPGR